VSRDKPFYFQINSS